MELSLYVLLSFCAPEAEDWTPQKSFHIKKVFRKNSVQ